MPSAHSVIEFARWLSLALADHLWQSSLVALLALLVARCLRGAPARLRYVVLLVGLAKFVVPVTFLSRSEMLEPAFEFAAGYIRLSSDFSYRVLTRGIEPAAYGWAYAGLGEVVPTADMFEWLVGGWLTIAAGLFALWFCRRFVFAARLRGCVLPPGAERGVMAEIRRLLKLRPKVDLIVSPEVGAPCVWRILRPVILLPPHLSDILDERELETVILHELIHVKRRDNLAGTLQLIICYLFWFHPLVWLLHRRLLREREIHCDEEVVKITGRQFAYASALLKVLESCVGRTVPGVSPAARMSEAKLRFVKILSPEPVPPRRRRHDVAIAALLSLVTVGIVLTSFMAGNRFTRSAILSRASASTYFSGGVPGREQGYWVSPVQGQKSYEEWKALSLIEPAGGAAPPHFYLSLTTERVSSRRAVVSVCVVPRRAPFRLEVRPVVGAAGQVGRTQAGIGRNDVVTKVVQEAEFSEHIFEIAVGDRAQGIQVKITPLGNEQESMELSGPLSDKLSTQTLGYQL